MGYTSIEQVRPYLLVRLPLGDTVLDQAVQLPGTERVRFYGGGVASDSVRVKLVRSSEPIRRSIVVGGGPIVLSGAPIVPGSVLVAGDSSLGLIYTENVDYVVSYDGGTLTMVAGGALSDGMTIVVWHLPYVVATGSEDYTLYAETGEVQRRAGGMINAGETVRMDFRPQYLEFGDDLLASSVEEANGLIEREVDPDGSFGADRTLGAAATSRALEIICRAGATRDLAQGQDRAATAQVWLKLAETYGARADRLIQAFHPPVLEPSKPRLT
jgi:hypothetical protein